MLGFFEAIISLWPLVIVLVVLLLGFLWYYQVKNMRKRRAKRPLPGLINPVILLGIITLLVLMLLALPFFFDRMEEYIEQEKDEQLVIDPEKVSKATFNILEIKDVENEELLNNVLKAHTAIKMVESSYKDNTTRVLFDSTNVSRDQIKDIIEANGFTVTNFNQSFPDRSKPNF